MERSFDNCYFGNSCECEVDYILDDRFMKDEKLYRVKWKGWPTACATWIPQEDLHCPEILNDYQSGIRSKPMTRKMEYKLYSIPNIVNRFDPSEIQWDNVEKVVLQYEKLKTTSALRITANNKSLKRRFFADHLDVPTKHSRKCPTAKLQAESLQAWTDEFAKFLGPKAVFVENKVDETGAPNDYKIIGDYMYADNIPYTENPIFCSCSDGHDCHKKRGGACECHTLHEGEPPYYKNGILRLGPGSLLFECNLRCKCGPTCPYRVVQNGSKIRFTIFRTNNRGWGVKARHYIREGLFVMEYLGEVIGFEEAERRGLMYEKKGLTYLFDLDGAGFADFTVDATRMGGIAAFVNHSCDPNLTVRSVIINNANFKVPRLAFFAARNILSSEELTFDYKMSGNNLNLSLKDNVDAYSEPSTSLPVPSESEVSTKGRVKCFCGSSNCRGYLY